MMLINCNLFLSEYFASFWYITVFLENGLQQEHIINVLISINTSNLYFRHCKCSKYFLKVHWPVMQYMLDVWYKIQAWLCQHVSCHWLKFLWLIEMSLFKWSYPECNDGSAELILCKKVRTFLNWFIFKLQKIKIKSKPLLLWPMHFGSCCDQFSTWYNIQCLLLGYL